MFTVKAEDFRRTRRRIWRFAWLMALLQMGLSLYLWRRWLLTPVVWVPPMTRFVTSQIYDAAGLFCIQFLWLLLPFLLVRYGIQVACPGCQRALPARFPRGMLYCPDCDEHFDDGTMARLAEQPPAPVRTLRDEGSSRRAGSGMERHRDGGVVGVTQSPGDA
jgi:hypothetical protein